MVWVFIARAFVRTCFAFLSFWNCGVGDGVLVLWVNTSSFG